MPSAIAHSSASICATLITVNKNGRKETIVLSFNKPVTIGRSPVHCSYVIPDIVVSNIHCKLYVVRSGANSIMVSCQDLSTNGILLNDQKFRRSNVILMDGDILRIPSSQSFECVHVWKEPEEKTNLFDPTPPRRLSHKCIGNYIVTSHSLGSGSFAVVHLAVDTATQRQVACKTVKVKKESELGKVMKEFKILLVLNHPNINRVFDVEVDGKFLHIFLQLCTGGDLFTYITSHAETRQRLCEGEAKYIMYQLLKGLKYLHDRMISHRDLKPENILLYSPGPYPRIQIADFGLARPRAYQETLNVCGTISYLPPEGILALDNKHLGYVGLPADCWSAGVILFIMLSGSHPFEMNADSWDSSYADTSAELYDSEVSESTIIYDSHVKRRIVQGSITFLPEIWDSILAARALVARLLIYNHLQRATVHSALESQWITSELNELEDAYQERIVKTAS